LDLPHRIITNSNIFNRFLYFNQYEDISLGIYLGVNSVHYFCLAEEID